MHSARSPPSQPSKKARLGFEDESESNDTFVRQETGKN